MKIILKACLYGIAAYILSDLAEPAVAARDRDAVLLILFGAFVLGMVLGSLIDIISDWGGTR